jgi:hypothetical protein
MMALDSPFLLDSSSHDALFTRETHTIHKTMVFIKCQRLFCVDYRAALSTMAGFP